MPDRSTPAALDRLARLDLLDGVFGARRIVAQAAVGLGALAAVAGVRFIFDLVAPGAAPFAFAYPAILVATLVGRLGGGLFAWVLVYTYLTIIGLPHEPDRFFANPLDLPRTIINAAVGLIVLLIAEVARSGAAEVLRQRDLRLKERDLLLSEFDHRLKNNLAILSGLIGMQIRETTNDEARAALEKAAGRIMSLGRTYDHLRYEPGAITMIDVSQFLDSLCVSLRQSLALEGRIVLRLAAEPGLVSRDRAAALALLVNEIVTNAVKHAFAGRTEGAIDLRFACHSGDATLTISDDGVGMGNAPHSPTSKGSSLMRPLAQMADCELEVSSGRTGTSYRLALRDVACRAS